MKIGIETDILLIDKAGSSVYTRELTESLKEIDKENAYYFFSYGSGLGGKNNLFKRKLENFTRDIYWMQSVLPRKLKKDGIDILHCTAFKAPLKCGVPLVVTFFDIHVLKHLKDYSLGLRLYCRFMLDKIAALSSKVITISEFSRKDIVSTFRIPEEKVSVTYCGVGEKFRLILDSKKKEEIAGKYGLKRRFIFYVGAIQPRKNIPSLLKAYSSLKKSSFDYQLVFAGGTGWKNKDVFDLVGELNIGQDVKFLGYVPEDDLVVIYNLAEFLVYPSFFEGFGMPVLEAMACGCPVISSNTSSFPEVVGDAGVMVDPYDVRELESAIGSMAKDNSLRKTMRERGIERAKMFSWKKCAAQTLEIYNDVLKTNS